MLESVLKARLESIASEGLLRRVATVTRQASGNLVATEEGSGLISFACNDYMALANSSEVKRAAIRAIELYGVGAQASRLVTGNHPLYRELEKKISDIYQTEAALVFSSGYLANIGSITSIVNRHDMVLADRFIHASAIDGARLSGAKIYRFAHNDLTHCRELLQKYRSEHRYCLVLVESVYGMDGDLAPVDDLVAMSKQYNAWLAVDTAHGFGITSTLQPDIYVGTLSKATGALGGYVCSSKTVIEYLQNTARSFIYTTALPPAIVAAASAAIDVIAKNCELPVKIAKEFCKIMELPKPQSHIVPIIMRDSQSATHAAEILAKRGFLVAAIRPPTAPTPRLRLAFTAAHTLHDIHKLCNALKQEDVIPKFGKSFDAAPVVT
ncbi:aminotransferase class I/II-fold pyridoxal phosphate-dependent enzyme [Anaplasma capra]|uniref:aminotransferase class I/II-fold pyridoxal phosphate-dependent enzyme n=1 Tax=Anaplasma capra TaxID=1562740 RepID=UPI0021D58BB9|nr:8-amino-7-oxononanoate synthase [Anaplasma capra]MCU7611338.1 8-amino-7-oxononanoate synthase [Anaplasma capra]MCU7612412.1 8-amino-7-oxononanoate synthase [Anaplasma capra]